MTLNNYVVPNCVSSQARTHLYVHVIGRNHHYYQHWYATITQLSIGVEYIMILWTWMTKKRLFLLGGNLIFSMIPDLWMLKVCKRVKDAGKSPFDGSVFWSCFNRVVQGWGQNPNANSPLAPSRFSYGVL